MGANLPGNHPRIGGNESARALRSSSCSIGPARLFLHPRGPGLSPGGRGFPIPKDFLQRRRPKETDAVLGIVCCQRLAVGRKGQVEHTLGSRERRDFTERGHLPQLDGTVIAGSCQGPPIWRKRAAQQPCLVPRQRSYLFAGGGIPESRGCVPASSGQESAFRRKGHSRNCRFVGVEAPKAAASDPVPLLFGMRSLAGTMTGSLIDAEDTLSCPCNKSVR